MYWTQANLVDFKNIFARPASCLGIYSDNAFGSQIKSSATKDITPQNFLEEAIACIIMVVSVGIFSTLMGSITAMAFDSQSEDLHAQKLKFVSRDWKPIAAAKLKVEIHASSYF